MKKQWMVNRASPECVGCKTGFESGQHYFSLLKLQKIDVVTWAAERFDYCCECWKGVDKKGEGSSYWKSVFAVSASAEERKDLARTKAGKFERLKSFLFEEEHPQDRQHSNLLFAIALMLERKKILIPCPEAQAGAFVYRHSKSGDTIVLKAPENIREDQSYIDEKIMEILGHVNVQTQNEESKLPEQELEAPQPAEAGENGDAEFVEN